MKLLEVKDDGAVHHNAFGGVWFDPSVDFKGQTWGAGSIFLAHNAGGSRAAVDVAAQDLILRVLCGSNGWQCARSIYLAPWNTMRKSHGVRNA
eukprot:SAG22_NODE_8330_length_663_cov_2.682624_1_plen_92_part_10